MKKVDAESGDRLDYAFQRAIWLAGSVYEEPVILVFNDIETTVNPESCVKDLCTIHDLKLQLIQLKVEHGIQ